MEQIVEHHGNVAMLHSSLPPYEQVKLDGVSLPIKELRGAKAIDLSNMKLGPASTSLIGSLMAANAELTRCDMRANMLGADGKAALRSAVQGRSGFKLML